MPLWKCSIKPVLEDFMYTPVSNLALFYDFLANERDLIITC